MPPISSEPSKEYDDFFRRYRSHLKRAQEQKLASVQRGFGYLRAGLSAIKGLQRELDKRLSKKFNIFQLLRVDRNEMRMHSSFLAELLDPDGSHDQGDLFLTEFQQHLHTKRSANQAVLAISQNTLPDARQPVWLVDTEKVTRYGKLDIVIDSPDLHETIVIENKIDAGEQQRQLARYAEWLNKERKGYSTTLIYLTPMGWQSSTNEGHPYLCFSYHNDIYDWLNACCKKVRSSRLRHVLRQYLEVIKDI